MKISAKNSIKELYMLDDLSSLVAMRKIYGVGPTQRSHIRKTNIHIVWTTTPGFRDSCHLAGSQIFCSMER
jgi:hypothetical protein